MNKKKILAFAFLAVVSSVALAHDDRPPQYLLFELPSPDQADPQCVPGYATSVGLVGLNNRRFAAGTANCYHDYGPTLEGKPSFSPLSKPYAWSPLTGAYLLPYQGSGAAFSVDEYNNAYGLQQATSLDGMKWQPGGGAPMALFPPDPLCGWNLAIAVDADSRGDVAGWAVRYDPADPAGCSIRTVVRRASGEEVVGPLNSTPAAITTSGMVAVGIDNHPAKWNSRTGEVVMLRPASDTENVGVRGLTERGVTLGVSIAYDSLPPAPLCYRAHGLLWDAANHERSLPPPAGAISSSPNAINEDEVIVGWSSASGCVNAPPQQSRAAIWIGTRALDLNQLVVGRSGIVLTEAAGINNRGEIVAYGYRAWEAKKPCPQTVFSADSGFPYTDDSVCRDTHGYLLVPLN